MFPTYVSKWTITVKYNSSWLQTSRWEKWTWWTRNLRLFVTPRIICLSSLKRLNLGCSLCNSEEVMKSDLCTFGSLTCITKCRPLRLRQRKKWIDKRIIEKILDFWIHFSFTYGRLYFEFYMAFKWLLYGIYMGIIWII